jgi:hypothetical protein
MEKTRESTHVEGTTGNRSQANVCVMCDELISGMEIVEQASVDLLLKKQ